MIFVSPPAATIGPSALALRRSSGFSMLELVGALAILSIAAAALTPPLVKRLSVANGRTEEQRLETIGSAYAEFVQQNQFIPGAVTWASAISSAVNLSSNEVGRVYPSDPTSARVFLVHPAFAPSDAADPIWTQTTAGAAVVANAEILIISSHHRGLALPVTSGPASSVAVFAAIWNWHFDPVSKAPPAGWPSAWDRNGEFLHVKRINLASYFCTVTFSNLATNSLAPAFQVAGASPTPMTGILATNAAFLLNTRIRVYKDPGKGGTLDLEFLIRKPANFAYENSRWRVE